MSRFYRLDVQPDLFGGVLLTKAWGRIGTEGRSAAQFFDNEPLAVEALQQQAERKRRRGYAEYSDNRIEATRLDYRQQL